MHSRAVADVQSLEHLVGRAFGFSVPATLASAVLLKDLELDAILAASSNPSIHSVRALRYIRQFAALYTKNESLSGSTKPIRDSRATATFLKVERYQRVVSKRLRYYLFLKGGGPGVRGQILRMARDEIFKLLGPSPVGEDIVDALSRARFGPGTCGGLLRGNSQPDCSPYGKLSPGNTIQVTLPCLQYWGPHMRGEFRTWLNDQPAELVQYCKSACVSKDAGTSRFIAVEPYLNVVLQLGTGEVLSNRLREWGVNLRNQEWNQRLAHVASCHSQFGEGFSTLDLSSASDSLNFELVRWLLPPGWFEFFNSTRSPAIKIGKSVVELEKFSSMGNGNTFPLESLVFTALIRSCRRYAGCKKPYAVYGDDLVVSHRITACLIEALSFCGFKLNQHKSFVIGSFRESCGKDFLEGHSVRPVYLKDPLTRPTLYKLANRLQQVRGSLAARIYESTVSAIPDPCIGPATSPDGVSLTHLVAPPYYLLKKKVLRWDAYYQAYRARYQAEVPRYRWISESKKRDTLAAYLSAVGYSMRSDRHSVRGTLGYKRRVVVEKKTLQVFPLQYSGSWYALD